MKTFYLLLFTLFALTACEPPKPPYTTYDAPFPKRNKKLTSILGDQLVLKQDTDTLYLDIVSTDEINTITNNKTGEVVFNGRVSKFRGLYFFSEQVNDSSYRIFAVRISDNAIYGLKAGWRQMMSVIAGIQYGMNKELVKYINTDTTVIRLHPDKKTMKEFYGRLLNGEPAETILYVKRIPALVTDTTSIASQVDAEESDVMVRVFPNPTTDLINIELQKNNASYMLTNLNGQTIQQGQLSKKTNQVNIKDQPPGVYILTLLSDAGRESVKIMKE